MGSPCCGASNWRCMIGSRCDRCCTREQWLKLLAQLAEYMAARRSSGVPTKWNLRSLRATRLRAKMRRMSKHQLYEFMDKGKTRLAALAHEVRDVRRNLPSSWRDPSNWEE